jgi:hypothetical protein
LGQFIFFVFYYFLFQRMWSLLGLVWLVTVMVRFLRFVVCGPSGGGSPSLIGQRSATSTAASFIHARQHETKRNKKKTKQKTRVQNEKFPREAFRVAHDSMQTYSNEIPTLACRGFWNWSHQPSLASHLWVEPHYPGAHVGPSMMSPGVDPDKGNMRLSCPSEPPSYFVYTADASVHTLFHPATARETTLSETIHSGTTLSAVIVARHIRRAKTPYSTVI